MHFGVNLMQAASNPSSAKKNDLIQNYRL